jgi:hypothetical protein
MSEETEKELEDLKLTADMMDIKYHPSIGLDKLKNKVYEATRAQTIVDIDIPAPEVEKAIVKPVETENEKRSRLKKEQLALKRIRLTCMNPMKSEWTGEIFTTGNDAVGSIRRFVPYNEEWHVEAIMLDMIENRRCQMFQKGVGKLVNEFAIETLPDLTKKEIDDLAQRQAMAAGTAKA